MIDNIKIAGELLSAAKQILAAKPVYVYDPSHKKKPRGGNWHKTDKGWSSIPKTKLAPIDFDEEKDKTEGKMSSKQYQKKKNTLWDNAKKYFDYDNDYGISISDLRNGIVSLNADDLNDFENYLVDECGVDHMPTFIDQAIVDNPNIGYDQLLNLATGEDDEDVLKSIVKHPLADDKVMSAIADNYGKDYLIDTLGVPRNKIKQTDSEKKVDAAYSKRTSPSLLAKLADDEDLDVRDGVARNPKTPVETLKKLADDEGVEIRIGVAYNPSTPVETLKKLADDEDSDVRRGTANNPKTPVETLKKLADDEDSDVRGGVAGNPSTSVETLKKLANDENSDVRYDVSSNPSTPVETLKKLANDEDIIVRRGVAGNSKVPVETLKKLANDEDLCVRRNVAGNRNTPVEILKKFANDENPDVRRFVGHNPKAPVETLKKLANDEDSDVRHEAQKCLKSLLNK